jgi:hypothetical protein
MVRMLSSCCCARRSPCCVADRTGQECFGEHAPVGHSGLARLDPDDLDADVVRARLDMGPKLLDDVTEVAPEYESSTKRSLPPWLRSCSE